MGAYEVLLQAKGLISTSQSWCKGNFAITASGWGTSSRDERAVAWCTIGAIEKVGPDFYIRNMAYTYLMKAINDLHPEVTGVSLSAFNDMADHNQVIQVFDLAIEL